MTKRKHIWGYIVAMAIVMAFLHTPCMCRTASLLSSAAFTHHCCHQPSPEQNQSTCPSHNTDTQLTAVLFDGAALSPSHTNIFIDATLSLPPLSSPIPAPTHISTEYERPLRSISPPHYYLSYQTFRS